MNGLFENLRRSFIDVVDHGVIQLVTSMRIIYRAMLAFTQPLLSWNVNQVTDMNGVLFSAANSFSSLYQGL